MYHWSDIDGEFFVRHTFSPEPNELYIAPGARQIVPPESRSSKDLPTASTVISAATRAISQHRSEKIPEDITQVEQTSSALGAKVLKRAAATQSPISSSREQVHGTLLDLLIPNPMQNEMPARTAMNLPPSDTDFAYKNRKGRTLSDGQGKD